MKTLVTSAVLFGLVSSSCGNDPDKTEDSTNEKSLTCKMEILPTGGISLTTSKSPVDEILMDRINVLTYFDYNKQKSSYVHHGELQHTSYTVVVGKETAACDASENDSSESKTSTDNEKDSDEQNMSEPSLVYQKIMLTEQTAKTQKSEVSFRCEIDTDPFVRCDDCRYQNRILASARPSKCEHGFIDGKSMKIPEDYSNNGTLTDARPSVKRFMLTRPEFDTTDEVFHIQELDADFSESFVDISSCHTMRLELQARNRDMSKSVHTISWENVVNPETNQRFWKRTPAEKTPRGDAVRAAMNEEVFLFFECDATFEPKEIQIGGPSDDTISSRLSDDHTLDIQIEIGDKSYSKDNLSVAKAKSWLKQIGLTDDQKPRYRLAIYNGKKELVAATDSHIVHRASDKKIFKQACSTKPSSAHYFNLDRPLYGRPMLEAKVTLCDISGLMLHQLSETQSNHVFAKEVEFATKCRVQNDSSNFYFARYQPGYAFINRSETACTFGKPSWDEGFQNIVPPTYAPGGVLEQQRLILDKLELKPTGQEDGTFDVIYEIKSRPIDHHHNCSKVILEVPYRKDDENKLARLVFQREFNPASSRVKVSDMLIWNAQSHGYWPTVSEIRARENFSIQWYQYCTWRPKDYNKAAGVEILD